MIIVLKNADFSANNIGQIEVPIIWDTDAKTFVDSLTGTISDERKRKINTLFVQLKAQQVFDKITSLYLPILGSSDGGKSIKGTSTITYPSASTFESKGVRLSLGFRMPNFNRSNGSIGVYNSAPIDSNSGTLSASLSFNTVNVESSAGTNPGRSAGRAVLNAGTSGGLTLGTPRITINGELKSVGFVAVSTNSSLVKTLCLLSKTVGTGDFAFSTNESASPIIGGLSIATNYGIVQAPIGCIFMGEYLTSTELTALGDVMDSFIANF